MTEQEFRALLYTPEYDARVDKHINNHPSQIWAIRGVGYKKPTYRKFEEEDELGITQLQFFAGCFEPRRRNGIYVR
jgi:uncharacterized short protein YbdD (DUF466 family)